jgi:hypothetical protein
MERRRAARVSTANCGVIVYGFSVAIECMIVNCSELGACIEVSASTDASAIPGEFVLLSDTPHPKRHCRVVWRLFQRLGVQFT